MKCLYSKSLLTTTGLAFAMPMKRLGYTVNRVPYSVKGCVGHSYCVAGCTACAKVTVHESYLQPSIQNGMRILTSTEALRVRPITDLNEEGCYGRNLAQMPFR